MTDLLATPASYFQRLHLERSDDGHLVHNVGLLWALRGQLDLPILKEALAGIIRRHEVLRSALRRTRRGIVQAIVQDVELPLREVDLIEIASTKRWRAMQRIARDDVSRAFDLTSPPLMRTTLARLHHHEHVLLVTVSHAVWDGWSTSVALDELAEWYGALLAREPPRLPAVQRQFADHVAQAAGSRDSPRTSRPPADRLRRSSCRLCESTNGATYDAATHAFVAASAAVKSRLQVVARQHGATLAMAVLAALAVVLRVELDENPAFIAVNDANRSDPASRHLIGPFLRFLLVGVSIDPASSHADALVRTRDSVMDAYNSMRFVDDCIRPAAGRSRSAEPVIHDVWLNFFPMVGAFVAASRARNVENLSIQPLFTFGAAEPRWNDGSLGLTIQEVPTGTLDAKFVYDASLLRADEAQLLADLYKRTLLALAVRRWKRVSAELTSGREWCLRSA